jgi:undecaprenyl-diphosphatase
MSLVKICILAIVQGLAELLPVSSSAHVVVAEKLLGLDPASSPMTLLLVMLHTGTMFAVIAYFWRQWREWYFQRAAALRTFAVQVVVATACTAVIGEGLVKLIERTLLAGVPHAEIEDLFGHLELIAPALAAAGILILVAGVFGNRRSTPADAPEALVAGALDVRRAALIGAVQGLCLPFRGFSRSGATISTGMLLGVAKVRAEAFSFALAVVLTPPVVARELLRLARDVHARGAGDLAAAALPSVLGALIAFLAGLLALRWLSRWLERGRWYLFGIYCLAASAAVMLLHRAGY